MFKLANSPAVAGSNKCSHVFYIQGEILRNLRKGQTGVFKGASPLTVSTLWGLVFLSFGSVFFFFAFKKKENELGVWGEKPHYKNKIPFKLRLFHCNRFRQISWLVNIFSEEFCYVISQQLQRNRCQNRRKYLISLRNFKYIFKNRFKLFVIT